MECLSFVLPAVYQALYLEELTLLDLSEKIAMLYSITPQQITHIYRQKPNGIHVLVCDEVSHLHQPPTLQTFVPFTNELYSRVLLSFTSSLDICVVTGCIVAAI